MGRMEILGRERRRTWSDEEKLRLLAEADEGGLSLAEVARRNDLFPQQLYAWRRSFRKVGPVSAAAKGAMRFLPVEVEASGPKRWPPRRRERPVEVTLSNGRRLRVDPDIEAEVLLRLVRALEQA